MKKGILVNVLIVTGFYLAAVFVSLEPSVFNWPTLGRALFAVFSVIAICMYWSVFYENRK
jgi:membrane protein implicated in regulation of membrane protease activity